MTELLSLINAVLVEYKMNNGTLINTNVLPLIETTSIYVMELFEGRYCSKFDIPRIPLDTRIFDPLSLVLTLVKTADTNTKLGVYLTEKNRYLLRLSENSVLEPIEVTNSDIFYSLQINRVKRLPRDSKLATLQKIFRLNQREDCDSFEDIDIDEGIISFRKTQLENRFNCNILADKNSDLENCSKIDSTLFEKIYFEISQELNPTYLQPCTSMKFYSSSSALIVPTNGKELPSLSIIFPRTILR
ncbi:uncharacterized protein LOC111695044 [Eurytemora carolleeae]|uniref:uncharacterized protein LOC111695044 n=1 Tax=Eurytemora carolleeae TaxID=1294199 RepID=UPI000C7903F8|nr:uncharacterized protein LOC111695044 [Eurytemora carolleeae]|eukprot:XP_023319962.1 uncharacterized protein LOC111695044 [Eurytemora affinis]